MTASVESISLSSEDPHDIEDDSTQSSYEDPASEKEDHVKYVKQMARKETRAVNFWLVVVTAVLLGAATTVTVLTFLSLESEENDDYETAVSSLSLVDLD